MRETGTLVREKGKTAVVSVEKREECAKCGLCLFKDGAMIVNNIKCNRTED